MREYRLKLPAMNVNFNGKELSFSINHIKSRRPSVLYFILHLYNLAGNEIYFDGSDVVETTTDVAYTSPRSVIGTAYSDDGGDYVHNFNIDKELIEPSAYYKIELVFLGIDSENPLRFSELMFQEGTYSEYHYPSELSKTHLIELPNTMYANLYSNEGEFLQVIRPRQEAFGTDTLNKAQYSILAPHFAEEDDVDDPVNIYLEAINQTEQTIDVLR